MKKIFTLLASSLLLAIGAKAQIANGDMELWTNYNSGTPAIALEAPNNWHGLDSSLAPYGFLLGGAKKQVFKSTDVHGGTYAAKLVSVSYTGFGVLPGVISNAAIAIDFANQDFTLSGGTPVTQRIASVSSWIKYAPKGNDTGLVAVYAVIRGAGAGGADSIIGEGAIAVTAMSSYTKLLTPITYYNAAVPTHIQIGFVSGNLDAGVDSSAMYVDDVTMTAANGVTQQVFLSNTVKCYPNPASNVLNLTTQEEQPLFWEAVAANGQVVASKEFTKNTTVSLSALSAGTYFFRVSNRNKEMIQTGKFSVVK